MGIPASSDSSQRLSGTALLPAPAPSSRTSLNEGSKFKLLAELGRGGMATVYLAVARGPAGFNKNVVVKCLRPSLAAEPEFLEMFLAEARLAARINHPNVVQTNEVGFDGQFYYIVMEYIEGPSLEAITRKAGGNMPVPIHIYALMQTLGGLHHAHELKDFEGKPLNVVHRDVSPHNVMVSYDGHVKLLDFGIAKAADSGGNTRTGIMKGKCAYMAAEQFGGHNVDRRADIFAAGVCLWQAITGARLWSGLSDAEIFSRLSRGEIPSPKTVRHNLPDELERICMKALALRPEDRFATAADFLTALEEFVSSHSEFRATQRDLSKYVGELFGAERAKIQATVDEQLKQVSQTGTSLINFAPETPSGLAMQMTGSNPVVAVPAAAPKSRGGLLAVIALLLVVIAGAGVFGARKFGKVGATKTTGATSAAEAKVTIKVTPDAAKIFFDDAPLQGNPATATFTRDGLAHRVRAEAPGFSRKTELVVLDSSNVSVDLELDPESDDEVDPFGNKLTAMTIKATPPTSHLFLDGTLLPTNPSVAKYPRDGKQHEIKAEAPGFITKTQAVKFDIVRKTVSLTLDKDPKYVPPPAGKAAAAAPAKPASVQRDAPPVADPTPAPTPAPAPKPLPTVEPPKKTTVDRGDPWAK